MCFWGQGGVGGMIPECTSSGVALKSAVTLPFTFVGRIHAIAVLQSSLEMLCLTPYSVSEL